MTEKQETYCKGLRSQIVATAIMKYGWSLDELHDIMKDWGYGESLRALSIPKLQNLKNTLKSNKMYMNDNITWDLDKQGKYMWHLMLNAGWTQKRLITFLIKKYHKTNWEDLEVFQKRGVISMLKKYQPEGVGL